jgi:hypothetical protein
MSEKACTLQYFANATYVTRSLFRAQKKIEKWREMPTRIFVPGFDWCTTSQKRRAKHLGVC